MEAAKDALLTAFDFYFEDNELIPLPSPLNSHDHFIEVPLSVASKVLLLNAFLQSEITQQELARRIGKPKQEITRLFNLLMRQKSTPSSSRQRRLAKSYRW